MRRRKRHFERACGSFMDSPISATETHPDPAHAPFPIRAFLVDLDDPARPVPDGGTRLPVPDIPSQPEALKTMATPAAATSGCDSRRTGPSGAPAGADRRRQRPAVPPRPTAGGRPPLSPFSYRFQHEQVTVVLDRPRFGLVSDIRVECGEAALDLLLGQVLEHGEGPQPQPGGVLAQAVREAVPDLIERDVLQPGIREDL